MDKLNIEREMSELYRIMDKARTLEAYRLRRTGSSNSTQQDMIQEPCQLPAPERYVRKQKSASKINTTDSSSTCVAALNPAADSSCAKSAVPSADPYDRLFEATIYAVDDVSDKFCAIGELNDSK